MWGKWNGVTRQKLGRLSGLKNPGNSLGVGVSNIPGPDPVPVLGLVNPRENPDNIAEFFLLMRYLVGPEGLANQLPSPDIPSCERYLISNSP